MIGDGMSTMSAPEIKRHVDKAIDPAAATVSGGLRAAILPCKMSNRKNEHERHERAAFNRVGRRAVGPHGLRTT